jgi:diguanylate cyclase (GGDEF)-like protein
MPALRPVVLVLPFAVDGVLALLRQAQGGSTSGYAPLAILPVIWVGLTRGPRAVAAMTVCTSALFAVPILVIGEPLYPHTGWRSVVLWGVVAAAVGVGARRVVGEQRRLTSEAGERAADLDRMVAAQNVISTADHDATEVMSAVVREALAAVGGDAACVEMLEGDEVVCTAVAGTAAPWLGLRLPAEDTITGECFRTGKVLVCTDSQSDTRTAQEACKAVGARSMILVPMAHGGDVEGVLIVWSSEPNHYGDYEAQLLALLGTTSGAALVRAALIAELTEHAVTDELTGLPNRRAWNAHLEQALARCRRSRQPLAVILLDLDGFKAVNDREGHAAGDALLRAVTTAWLPVLRTTDRLGRLGGDEFAIVVEPGDETAAEDVVDRLRRATPAPHHASAGSAVWDGEESAADLLARADAHMYSRKAERRRISS